MKWNPYLTFGGNCATAFKYYERVLGGKIVALMTHADMPKNDQMQAPTELALDRSVEIAAVAWGGIEQAQRRDVHRCLFGFQMQERRVDAAQGFHDSRLLRRPAVIL